VAVRRDQLASACARLTGLAGKPALVFFGNNPAGRSAITGEMPGDTYLGFPDVGGVMTAGTADYVRIGCRLAGTTTLSQRPPPQWMNSAIATYWQAAAAQT
jgi:hypothetical protein